MIEFRCWYCNRRHRAPEARIGERRACNCSHKLRVPKRSGGNCRVKTITDRLVEAVVYGGGGALLGLGLALVVLYCLLRLALLEGGWVVLMGLPAAGFLIGFFGGEAGVRMLMGMYGDRDRP
jgi:hypothetical protein